MIALVFAASPALSWPVFVLACGLFLLALVLIATDTPQRVRVIGGVLLAGLGPCVVVSGEICKWLPILLECWLL